MGIAAHENDEDKRGKYIVLWREVVKDKNVVECQRGGQHDGHREGRAGTLPHAEEIMSDIVQGCDQFRFHGQPGIGQEARHPQGGREQHQDKVLDQETGFEEFDQHDELCISIFPRFHSQDTL